MVNWKDTESTDRLIAAMLAGQPGLKLDYSAIATFFGQGATYDAIEGRFRRYRKMAEDLKADARRRGITNIPPRTPRAPRSNRTKASSSGRNKRSAQAPDHASPTKRRAAASEGQSLMDAILVDDNKDEADTDSKVKIQHDLTVDDDVEIVEAPGSVSSTATITKSESPGRGSRVRVASNSVKLENGAPAPARESLVLTVADPAHFGPPVMQQDLFGFGGFYFVNPPAGDELDDIFGGAA
ncbi:hypothetical protein BDV59DRAFT_204222 [Aspergillus ambiguus]|uniref:uncharacterized protein n=1 Tax=Aspergillus ambiguus TaxID=176160 RepID=UPI003CCD6C2A